MRRLCRSAAIAAASALAACGTASPNALSAASATPTPALSTSASPSASPSLTHYPPSAVRVVVNGVERAPESSIIVDGLGGTSVVLTFPFSVDRASVEQFLSRRGGLTWSDNDRTLALSFPEAEPFPGFKVAQVRSVDGQAVLDLLIVNVVYAPSVVLSVYSIADATALGGAKPSASWRVPGVGRAAVFSVSPDLKRVLLYTQPATGTAVQSPRVLELATRALTPLSLPSTEQSFIFGGWTPDGTVILVGSAVWSSVAATDPMRQVADLGGLRPISAQLSPRGRYVAVAGPDRIVVVDLRDRSVRQITGSTRGCVPGLAWSSDDRLLAWLDCAAAAVWISDVATNTVVRSIAGAARNVVSMPSGDIVVTRESGEQGAGARSLGVVYSFDGVEKARYLGYAWSASADGRYLLNIGSCCAGGPSSSLTDLRSPGAPPIFLPGIASWTADGRILVAGGGY